MYTNSKLNKAVRLALAFGAASTMALAGVASAQEENEEEREARESERPERIQIVGSRIRTDGLDSATPIDIISAEIATEQGLNTLGELLRTSTIASGSDQLISAYSVGFVTAGGAGNESISMRGLGANRTLVLLNGRRAGPAGTRGQISAFDMNALPVSVVERVEILKDGASSLYGSDAVAGVINIITKRGDDASINVSGSQPFDSGGETYRVNGTFGRSFDRGSWRVVGDYNVNTGLQRGDRDYFACSQRYLFDQLGNRADPIDPRTGDYHCNEAGFGIFTSGGSGGRFQWDYTGNGGFPDITDHSGVNAAPAGWYWAPLTKEGDALLDGGNHPFRRTQSMIPETEVLSLYAQADYDLTDTISMYAEFLHSSRETTLRSTRQFWTAELGYRPIGIYNLPGWDANVNVMPVSYTDWTGNTTTVDYTRGVIGIEGSIGYWNWDASWQRSYNSGEYDTKIIYYDSMLMAQEALLGLRDCGPGEVTQYSQKQCVPVPFFSQQMMVGNVSDDVRDFLFGRDVGRSIYKQDTFDAYITGDLYDLPAGTLATAVGIYYQTDKLQDTPGYHTLNGNLWGSSSSGITAGDSNTKAVYAELQIPILRDLPMVESLDLTASGRWTDVNTYGSDTTYKISALWDVAAGFRVRASRGTSFRAPALFELFLENQTGFQSQLAVDPCVNWNQSQNDRIRANCQADGVPVDYAGGGSSATVITGGGAGQLNAETSVSKGIGLVYTSAQNRFAASIDYYDVTINDQVSNVGGASVASRCYNSENFANEPFCRQITRRDGSLGDFGIDQIRGGYLNTAQQIVRGVDMVATYTHPFSFGDVRIRWDHTNQIERSFLQFADSNPIYYIGRVGSPKHSGTINTSFARNDWRVNWSLRYVGSTNNAPFSASGTNLTTYRGQSVTHVMHTPTYVLHNLSVNKRFDNLDLTVGVANLFDKEPPTASPSGTSVVGNAVFFSQYDFLGRRAFFNATYSF